MSYLAITALHHKVEALPTGIGFDSADGLINVVPFPTPFGLALDITAADVPDTFGLDVVVTFTRSDTDTGYRVSRNHGTVERVTPMFTHGRYAIFPEATGRITYVPSDNPYVIRDLSGHESPSRDTHHPLTPDHTQVLRWGQTRVTNIHHRRPWTLGEDADLQGQQTRLLARHDDGRLFTVWDTGDYCPQPAMLVTHPDQTCTVVVSNAQGGTADYIPSSSFVEMGTTDPPPAPIETGYLKSYERKLFFGCYNAFTPRSDYENATAATYIGNILLDGPYPGEPPLPFIQDVGSYVPSLEHVTVGYRIEAQGEFANFRPAYDQGLALPEKPITMVGDSPHPSFWPTTLPPWIDRHRTFFGVELYRLPGPESVEDCETRWEQLLVWAGQHDLPLVIVLQSYDANGQLSADDVVEMYPAVDRLVRQRPNQIIGFFCFSWGRPGSMTDHPAIMAGTRRFFNAVPARPNRFDGWLSSTWKIDLKTKCQYTTPMFRNEEIDYLRSLITNDLNQE